VLFYLPEDDLAETAEIFSGLNPNWDVPKPFSDRGAQVCGIISLDAIFDFKDLVYRYDNGRVSPLVINHHVKSSALK
jgi:hypothetical protein